MKTRLKIAILGGSFNPVHIGHIALAKTACKIMKFDKLLFVPAYISPFKTAFDTSDDDRLNMLKIAISEANNDVFGIETCEIERKGVSYTIETINFLTEKYKQKVSFIMGDDLVADFSKWKSPGEIAEKSEIVLARRNSAKEIYFPYKHKLLDNALLPVSSSDIRNKIQSGENWQSLVSEGVSEYIISRKLYGCN